MKNKDWPDSETGERLAERLQRAGEVVFALNSDDVATAYELMTGRKMDSVKFKQAMKDMSKNRIYISGPMKGVPDYEYNFNAAELSLLDDYPDAEVVNPVTIALNYSKKLGKTFAHIPYREFFAQDINELMRCDAVFMLNGWEKSKGARAEHAVAVALDLRIVYQ